MRIISEQDLLSKSSRFYVKRGLKQDYARIKKYEGEIYYLIDTNELASHKSIYKNTVDGGWFGHEAYSKYEGIDGGEF